VFVITSDSRGSMSGRVTTESQTGENLARLSWKRERCNHVLEQPVYQNTAGQSVLHLQFCARTSLFWNDLPYQPGGQSACFTKAVELRIAVHPPTYQA
jgi:hypothetical protein